MTQETTRDVIVYTLQDDNKINIIGEFETITISVRTCSIEDVYIEGETQIAFVLERGVIKFKHQELKPNTFVTRGPRFNISYDSYEINFNNNKVIGDVKGRYELVRCMLDTAVDNKVEGVAEYIKFIPQTVEDFITSNK
jgi:hypothetical protein